MPISDWIEKDRENLIKTGKQVVGTAMQDMVFRPFTGKDDNAIIKISEEFATETSIAKIRLSGRLIGAGAQGNTDVSKNRDQMLNLYQECRPLDFSNSVKSDNVKIQSRMAANTFAKDSQVQLIEWVNTETTNIQFAKLSENCTNIVAANKIDGIYTGADACSKIETSDVFSTRVIEECVIRAKEGRDHLGKATPRLRPFIIKPNAQLGISVPLKYYLMIVDTTSANQLSNDVLWLEAQKMAAERGIMNNIFTGALGIYKGVVLIETQNRDDEQNYAGIHTSKMGAFRNYTTDFAMYQGKAGIETSINLFLGATAGVMPFNTKSPSYWEGSDDENEKMICRISATLGFEKAKFKGVTEEEKKSVYHDKDYGVIAAINGREQL